MTWKKRNIIIKITEPAIDMLIILVYYCIRYLIQ